MQIQAQSGLASSAAGALQLLAFGLCRAHVGTRLYYIIIVVVRRQARSSDWFVDEGWDFTWCVYIQLFAHLWSDVKHLLYVLGAAQRG
jgi:hypothetical protein